MVKPAAPGSKSQTRHWQPVTFAGEIGAQLVYISTDYVFDGEAAPYAAEAPASPVNEYGRTKLEGEKVTLANCPGTSRQPDISCPCKLCSVAMEIEHYSLSVRYQNATAANRTSRTSPGTGQ